MSVQTVAGEQDRTPLIKDAQRQARKLIRQRPWSVRPMQWAMVVNVLIELACHVPDVRPSQIGLAKALGVQRITVRRALDLAEAHGLIERQVRESEDRWDGTQYTLRFWSGHTPLSTTSQHDPVAQSEPQPYGSERATAMAQSEPPNGFSDENKPPGLPSEDKASAAPAAAVTRGQRGINQFPARCGECGTNLEPGEATAGRDKRNWLCLDRDACHGRQTATALERAEDQRKQEERERQRREYEQSPEGIADRERRAAWAKANPSAREREAQAKREHRDEMARYRAALTMECGCNRTHFMHRADCPTHAHERNAEFKEKRRA